jgi:multiple sugar transport system permease protein
MDAETIDLIDRPGARGGSARRKRPWLTASRRMAIAGYAFLLPNIVGFLVFSALPVFAVVALSIFKWDVFTPPKFVGLANYEKLFFRDSIFRKAVVGTGYYVVLTVPALIVIGVALAVLVNQRIKGIGIFRTMYFVPYVGLLVAEALVWLWLYDADFGLFNTMLRKAGLQPVRWLGSTDWAMPSVALMSIWRTSGYYMVIFLAGLQAIPSELYEAAAIDGAGTWQRFAIITIPLLTPVIFLALVIAIINTFQVFTSAWILTQGGPYYATTTVVMRIYSSAFVDLRMGYGSTIALVFFVVVATVTLIQMRMQRRWVYYEYE